MHRILYTLLLYLFVPLVILRLIWRGLKAPAYLHRWNERFGILPFRIDRGSIWVHAVSVGEAQAALPLINALIEKYPELPVIVTTTTPTGSNQVQNSLTGKVYHCYMPYDLPGSVKRFLARAMPRVAIIMETELWPNLYSLCVSREIPIIVANARISERSAKKYLRFSTLTAQTVNHASRLIMQGNEDARRMVNLGANQDRVSVSGNIKFDLQLPESLHEQAASLRRSWGQQRAVWIAASTHEGEDEQILAAFSTVKERVSNALLILVPRHPERFGEVSDLCCQSGFKVIRRSDQVDCDECVDVFVGDTMGELRLFYAAADVAFVGGSLVPVGGHNVLEPAALKKPVVFGPHMFNFAEIARMLLNADAAQQIENSHELASAITALLVDVELRAQLGEKAGQIVDSNRGALAKTMGIISNYIDHYD